MSETDSINVWQDLYADGHGLNRYPWDAVVSFVFRNAPRDRPRTEVHIIEVGCGTGGNLWFAAREGFRVAGIDISDAAVAYARQRLAADALEGDVRAGDFTSLPFADNSFDLAIDRAAITCAADREAAHAVAELHRVLRPGGRFLCNVYSDRHGSSSEGRPAGDGRTISIARGLLVGVGAIRFHTRRSLLALFPDEQWAVVSLEHLHLSDEHGDGSRDLGEWRIVVQRR